MLGKFSHYTLGFRTRVDAVLHHAEAVFTAIAGSEVQWWPFGFLRPRPDERFSTTRVAMLAALQGLPLGLFLVILDGTARRAATEHRLPVFLFIVFVGVFATNRLTLAYFWNRRVERVARHRERLQRWKAGG